MSAGGARGREQSEALRTVDEAARLAARHTYAGRPELAVKWQRVWYAANRNLGQLIGGKS